MSWLQRLGGSPGREEEPDPEEAERASGVVRRSSPGLAALWEGVKEGGDHAVLDLGPAAGDHLTLFSSFAGQVCFGDLLPEPPRGAALRSALAAIPTHGRLPYDVILLWNVLDRVTPEERRAIVRRVTEISARGARLYAVVESSDEPTTRPLRFKLLDRTHVRQEPVGPPERAGARLLPAEVERLLAPWEVVRAFTLRVGLREYVAVRGG